jgi:hypothetical protein
MPSPLVAFVGSVLLFASLGASAATSAEGPPAAKGVWILNRKLSGDIEGRIKDAAGSQFMTGSGPGWAPPETWLPLGVKFDDAERLEVRKFLLAVVPVLQRLEIEVSPTEVKTIHGEDGARIFSRTRKNAGSSAMTGQTVMRHATLQGAQLLLESKGKDSLLTETITVGAEGQQMTCVLHFEAKLLEKPLDLNLVYDRAGK